MSLSNKRRFAIFERDQFACQYCGKKPPEIILQVDHMISKKDGGTDDEMNLITSCFACNNGKSSSTVSIDMVKGAALRREVKTLQNKKQQLAAYYRYLRKKDEVTEMVVDELVNTWKVKSSFTSSVTPDGRNSVRALLRQNTVEMVREAMEITWSKSYVPEEAKFRYMCGVLKNMREKRIPHPNGY